MKSKVKLIRYPGILAILVFLALPSIVLAAAATMQDFCQVPPFIGVTKPNLLLMIDNSASMYDLEYVDLGKKVCSTAQTTVCTTNADCPSGETCSVIKRNATYCYDESYSSAKTYDGYFASALFYQYDLTNGYFYTVASFPADAGACAGTHTAKYRANTLCAEIDVTTSPKALLRFVANGNYLNWLTASKFDIEKGILTGGRYATKVCSLSGAGCLSDSECPSGQACIASVVPFLQGESRGCVGRKFVKEALSADFINYNQCNPPLPDCDPNVPNSLGLAFGIDGPHNTSNPSDVSRGGPTTAIDIFLGDYNAGLCQKAITDYLDPNTQKQTFIDDIGTCIGYSATNRKTCSLDNSIFCNSDTDCAGVTGTCNIVSGSCQAAGGVCGVTTAGTCTANNGRCTGAMICVGGNRAGSACTRRQDCTGNGDCLATCAGGGRAGSTCTADSQCAYNACTIGKVGSTCSVNTDCDVKSCTNAGATFGRSCVVNADCNVGTCLTGRVGDLCSTNSDCTTGSCAAGSPVIPIPNVCASNADCSSGFKGYCLQPVTTQIKSTFAQSMHSCYQFKNGTDVGTNEIQQVSNPAGCNQMYAQYRTCNGGSKDQLQCYTAADCPGGSCQGGPASIHAGDPVLLCSSTYAGYCATSTCSNDSTRACATDSDCAVGGTCWATTNWVQREYASSDDCILAMYRKYCGALETPPVTDPTDDPSNTSNFANLPAIISDMGVEGQLGSPIAKMLVQVKMDSAPTGLVQEFSNLIRIGAMSFDFNGSRTECGTMKYCSNNIARICTTNADCGTPGQCVPAVPCPYVCANDTTKACTPLLGGQTDVCDTGVSCVPSSSLLIDTNLDGSHILSNSYVGNAIPVTPAGGHTTAAGIVHALDNLGASSWTPFSEAFYNVIGYYAETSITSPLTVRRLNSGDFDTPLSIPTPQPAPSQSNCQKNNFLLITDGQSTADLNTTVSGLITSNSTRFPSANYTLTYDTTFNNACYLYAGSRNLDDLAWLAQHRDIHNFANAPVYDKDRIKSYVVYSGTGTLTSANCSAKTDAQLASMDECQPDNLMCKTAKNGGGTYYLAQNPPALKQSLKNAFLDIAAKATSGTAASVLASGEGSGANLIQALFYPRRQFDLNTETLWAGSLQTLWYYVDPFFTYSNIREDTPALGVQDHILNLASDDIANLQMLGTCSTDPSLYCVTDADCGAAAPCLQQRVRVKRYRDVNGDGGTSQTYIDTLEIEDIHSLWEAGKKLWNTTPPSRTMYANCISSASCILDASARSTGVMSFSSVNAAALRPYLQASDANESTKVIRWIRGYDKFCSGTTTPCTQDADCSPATCSDTSYRSRTVGFDLNGNSVADAGETQVWKLGDVLNSTPKIASWIPLNTYHRVYMDGSYGVPGREQFPDQGPDETHFITTSSYMQRGMVFAGANDGMLHAFKLGTLGLKWASQTFGQKATLGKHCSGAPKGCVVNSDCDSPQTCVSDTDIGTEVWTFIPKNALPYLKYIADPNYCHVYSVDLTPYIFDASIEGPDTTCSDLSNYWNCSRTKDSWRTILIGGMRLGGGCKARVCSATTTTKCGGDSDCPAGETCVTPSTTKVCSSHVGTSCGADADCPDVSSGERCIPITVGTPMLDPADPTKAFGYSSYFALDITEALADSTKPPRLLWEFSDNDLGFSSSGPAIVRIKALKDPSDPAQGAEIAPGNKDGRWFVVFGSGATGPISDTQFLGSSDQNLKYFVIDLKTGSLLRTIDTGIQNAFSGSLLNANFDSDLDYQDDVVYSGYVKKCTNLLHPCSSGTWTDGGVGRLVTGDRITAANHYQRLNPDNWTFSEVRDGIGPVTSSVVKLQDNTRKKLWVYFGTGRYFYKTSTVADDNNQRRTLYGIKDPCFDTSGVPGAFDSGCTDEAGSVTDVTSVSAGANGDQSWSIDMAAAAGVLGAERVITDPLATSTGLVFFTTFAPYSDICTLGGSSYIWALKYDTGGAPGALLKGKALVQVSTGKIEQVDLSTQFTEAGGRRTAGMEGVPPTAQGLSIITSPPPIKRVLHMRER